MKESDKHIDKIFQEELKDFEVQPPEQIWEAVQKGISVRRKKKPFPLFYKWAAGIALLVTSSALLYFLSNSPQQFQLQSLKSKQDVTENLPSDMNSRKLEISESSGTKLPVPDKDLEKALLSEGKYGLTPKLKRVIDQPVETIDNFAYYTFSKIDYLEKKQPRFRKTENAEIQKLHFFSSAEMPETKQNDFFRNWTIGMSMAPAFSYRTVNSSPENSFFKSYLNNSENGKLSYSGNFYLKKKFTENLSLRTGIKFSNQGFSTGEISFISGIEKYDAVYGTDITGFSPDLLLRNSAGNITYKAEGLYVNHTPGIEYSSLSGVILTSDIEKNPNAKLIQNLYYFGIPLEALYRLPGRNNLYILLGFELNFLVNNKVFLHTGNSKNYIGNTVGLNKINYTATFGLGIEILLHQNIRFTVEPVFNYFISPINSNHVVTTRPYSLGIAMGINMPL